MTAAPLATKVPLSPLALILFTLAVASTASVTFGFWFAGVQGRARTSQAAGQGGDITPAARPRRRRRVDPIDDITAGFAALDSRELDRLEQRLRDTER